MNIEEARPSLSPVSNWHASGGGFNFASSSAFWPWDISGAVLARHEEDAR